MKMNRKWMHAAYIKTALELSSMETIAERISDFAGMEVSKVKTSGFVLRQTSGGTADNETLKTCIYKGVCDILDDDIEETTDHITENYDMVYNPDEIDQDKLMELFDINRDGRLIYVELDL